MLLKPGRNGTCHCGSGRKYKKCHLAIYRQMAVLKKAGYEVPHVRLLKNVKQIEGIRESSKINIALLDDIGEHVREGISTGELDRLIYEKTIALGGIPAPLNYNGFPKSSCISIDSVVCHGIPADTAILKSGQIVNIDVSTICKGYYSDSSRMFCIGEVSSGKRNLVETARQCMERGIESIRPWGFLGDIGEAVKDCAAEAGYSVVREIGGHGIGLAFHEDPWVSHVADRGTGMILVPGMVFTVEPMINMGGAGIVTDSQDGWTVYTADGLPSAQWEKTVLVTETGYEILTY